MEEFFKKLEELNLNDAFRKEIMEISIEFTMPLDVKIERSYKALEILHKYGHLTGTEPKKLIEQLESQLKVFEEERKNNENSI